MEDVLLQGSKENTVKTVSGAEKQALDCVRIVMPSEWAKMDVATDSFFRMVYEPDKRGRDNTVDVE